MALTRKRALWVDQESTYGTDPSADGSGYAAVPCLELGDLVDGKAMLETNYATGRPYDTAPVAGMDGWSFTCSVPLIGLSSAAADGTNASSVADDWLDYILDHIFGDVQETEGDALTAIDTTTPDGWTGTATPSKSLAVQDLVPVWEASIPSATAERSMWHLVLTAPGSEVVTIAPDWDTDPTTAAVLYGAKIYRSDDDNGGGSLAFVYQDDSVGTYELLGGRCTSASISGEVGQIIRLNLTFEGDTKTEDAAGKSALVDALSAPAITPIKMILDPLWFNATKYCIRRFDLDLGVQTAEDLTGCAGSEGRAGFQNVGFAPTLTVTAARTDAITNLKRNVTTGRLLLQMGAGQVSGGVLNSMCFHAEEAVVMEAGFADDSGIARNSIQFKITDKVNFSTGVAAEFIQLARA